MNKQQYLASLPDDALNNLDTKVGIKNQVQAKPNSFVSAIGNMVDGALAKKQPLMPERITRSSYNDWLNTLNPEDYQTALNPQEVQQFSDWAAKNSAPISKDYDMQGYWKNEIAPYEALAQQGFTPEQIAGARQGLNGGNAKLAEFIAQHNINKPATTSEIALAKQGKLNAVPYDAETRHFTDKYKTPWHEYFSNESQYATGDAAKYAGTWDGDKFNSPIQDDNSSTVQDILAQVKQGYDDYSGTDKTGWNKVGKGIDATRAILSNPALQGVIAGAAYGKYRGDALEGLKYGMDWAGNKANSNYYARALGEKPGVLGNFTAKDYAAKATADYQNTKNEIYLKNVESQISHRLEQEKLDWAKLAEMLRKNQVSEQLAREKFNLSVKQLNEMVRYHNGQLALGKQRVGISQQNANLARDKFNYMKAHPKKASGKQISPIEYQKELWKIQDSDLDDDVKNARLSELQNLYILQGEEDEEDDLARDLFGD